MDIDLRFIRRYTPPEGPPPGGPTWEAFCVSLADETEKPPRGVSIKTLHAWILRHPVWFANRYIRTRIEGGKQANLRLDMVQFVVLATIWWYLFVVKNPLLMPILKGRRSRVTTGTAIAILILTFFDSGKHACAIGKDDKSLRKIWRDIYVSMETNLPKTKRAFAVPHKHPRKNPQGFEWYRLVDVRRKAPDGTVTEETVYRPSDGSTIEKISAESGAGPAGTAIDFFHYLEIGFDGPDWQRTRDIAEMCKPRQSPYWFIVFESTGEKIGSYFRKLWDEANGEGSTMYPLFIGWFESPVCRRKLHPGQTIPLVGKTIAEQEEDRIEQGRNRLAIRAAWQIDAVEDLGERATLEHEMEEALNWRARDMIAGQTSIAAWRFLNPTVPDDAWLSPGASFFDTAALDRMTRWTRDRAAARANRVKYPVAPQYPMAGNIEGLTYIHAPRRDGWYFVTTDGSLGTADGDEARVYVWNLNPPKERTRAHMRLEVVWHGRKPPETVEWVAAQLECQYRTEGNASLWIPENNDRGGDRMIQIRIRKNAETHGERLPIYRPRPIVPRHRNEVPPYGFSTNIHTRTVALHAADEMLRDGAIEIEDLGTLAQMRGFGTDGNGKLRGTKGVADDAVSNVWMACYYAWEQKVHTMRADMDRLMAAADAGDLELVAEVSREEQESARATTLREKYPQYGDGIIDRLVDEEMGDAAPPSRPGGKREPFFLTSDQPARDWRFGYVNAGVGADDE